MPKHREPGLITPPKSRPNARDTTASEIPVKGTQAVGNFGERGQGDNQYTVRKVPASATATTKPRGA